MEKMISIFISFLVISGFVGCIDNNEQYKEKKDILIIGVLDNTSIYPYGFIENGANVLTILVNLQEGLVDLDENLQILPCLAQSWNNPDDYTWRFNLRKNVKFHNDYLFTAEDAKFSLELFFAENNSFVKDIVIFDNYTIDVFTYEPIPDFLYILGQQVFIFSYRYANETGEIWPIGTGAYKLEEYVENNYTKLERFDDYWNGKSEIKTVIFKVIEDVQKRINGLLDGTLDIAEYNIDDNIDEIRENKNITILTHPSISTYIMGFDFRENNSYGFQDRKNPTSDIRVRKAIYHAIDIEPIIYGPFKGYAKPATQFLTPHIFGYNPSISRLAYDPDLAKQLLDEAGYPEGFDIELDCITVGYEYNYEHCKIISEQLKEIGINVSINGLSGEEFNKKVVYERNTSMWIIGWSYTSSQGGRLYKHLIMTNDGEKGTLNSGYYSNPEVDRLGSEALLEMDPQKQLSLLQGGFKIAVEDDIVVVPLISQELIILHSNELDIQPRADLELLIKEINIQ